MDEETEKINEEPQEKCPICGEEDLVKVGHCITCYSCGYSLCAI